jgi:hypothetical protein
MGWFWKALFVLETEIKESQTLLEVSIAVITPDYPLIFPHVCHPQLYKSKAKQLRLIREQYVAGRRGGVTRHGLGVLLGNAASMQRTSAAVFEENFVRRAVLTMPALRSVPQTEGNETAEQGVGDVGSDDEQKGDELGGKWRASVNAVGVITFAQRAAQNRRSNKRGSANSPPLAQSLSLVVETSTAEATSDATTTLSVPGVTSALRFFETNGDELHRINIDNALDPSPIAEGRVPPGEAVRMASVDAENNDPLVVCVDHTDKLHLFNLTLWHGNKVIGGRRPRSVREKTVDPKTGRERVKIKRAKPPPSTSLSGLALSSNYERTIATYRVAAANGDEGGAGATGGGKQVCEEGGDDESCGDVGADYGRITRVVLHNSRRKKLIVTGHTSGIINVNLRNGTLVRFV